MKTSLHRDVFSMVNLNAYTQKMQQKQNASIPLTRLIDSELSAYIEKKDLIYREAHQKTAAKLSVMDISKLPKNTSIRSYIGGMRSDYQHLVDQIDLRLDGRVEKLQGQSHVSDNENNLKDLQRRSASLEKRLAPLKGKFDETGKKFKTAIQKWHRFFIPLLVFLSVIELIANFDSLNSLGGSRVSSLGLALLTAICIYWYAHFTPDKIRKYAGDNVKRQVLLFLGFLIPIIVVFYFFSVMRIQYMVAMNPELSKVFNMNPLVFTIINAFAYTISCWIIFAYKPGKEAMVAYKQYQSDQREITGLEQEIERLKQEESTLDPMLREKLLERYAVLRLGKKLEDDVLTRLEGCFESFKMELFLKTNGECTSLFSEKSADDLPVLKLNYQDIDTPFGQS